MKKSDRINFNILKGLKNAKNDTQRLYVNMLGGGGVVVEFKTLRFYKNGIDNYIVEFFMDNMKELCYGTIISLAERRRLQDVLQERYGVKHE